MRRFFLLFLLFCTVIVTAQPKTITGKVVNEKNEPVGFATIKIKNSNAGVSADAQGSFSINASSSDVLLISATGHGFKRSNSWNQKLILL